MSTCIRAGARYSRHVWENERCARCGQKQFLDFSSDEPDDEAAIEQSETEPQPIVTQDVAVYGEKELIQFCEDNNVPRRGDLTDPNNKDSIKE